MKNLDIKTWVNDTWKIKVLQSLDVIWIIYSFISVYEKCD